MCNEKKSGGIIHFKENTLFMASTLAHEMAHSFGLIHDDAKCGCKDAVCIMKVNIKSSQIPTLWSNCSINTFNKVLVNPFVTSCLK